MGTREDLLAAAKQCLAERGYARTTVREIVAASGSNLAAINYHFGTRDKLLNQAMIESSSEAVQRIAAALPVDGSATAPAARLEAFWRELIASFTADRPLWSANVEGMAQALHSPEVRAELAVAQRRAREEIWQLFGPSRGAEADRAIGAVLHALIGGLMAQWLIDPEHAPSSDDLIAGLRALATESGTD
ncbi:TetR/AcrR family transcriptional regulator [Nocardia gipuzkoensis]|uniref:TetR/AcrR family transcriptional regulator n=1 Tax=Nocardia gipuzkoensis TaxID=2749991 RepID=UPI00237D72F2|nr:TetR/AcrR family transcriptional regulator [Nocardia gipuzkoensis]MDE1672298.1 TetR/AcrR family transcriptional regulator [Nocardia gipuzkoensis]